jgi:hypothetical protein
MTSTVRTEQTLPMGGGKCDQGEDAVRRGTQRIAKVSPIHSNFRHWYASKVCATSGMERKAVIA